jgi:hypothetical protein
MYFDVRLFVPQTGSAMTGVRGNEDSDNFSDDESTPLYSGRLVQHTALSPLCLGQHSLKFPQ